MNKLILLSGIALLVSCAQKETTSDPENTSETAIAAKDTLPEKVSYYKVNGKAILLGNPIKLLDEQFKETKDISSLNGQMVEVREVSDRYYKSNPADDHCQEFKYVKIAAKGLEGYVDGRSLYEPVKSTQNKTVRIDGHKISLTVTSHFGIGVADDDGLTTCQVRTPALFSDEAAHYEGLVYMIKNKHDTDQYPYFELKADAGAHDDITSINKQNDHYLIRIERTYQEGGAKLLVVIRRDDDGKFFAEIVEYKEFN